MRVRADCMVGGGGLPTGRRGGPKMEEVQRTACLSGSPFVSCSPQMQYVYVDERRDQWPAGRPCSCDNVIPEPENDIGEADDES